MINEENLDNENSLDSFYMSALLLSEVVTRTLDQRAHIQLSSPPILRKIPIVEFRKRMRVWVLEKFDGSASISTVNFYVSEEDKKNGKAVGAVILYLSHRYIHQLFKSLGYPELNIDDEEELSDAAGTFVNIIAAKFKSGLIQLGFIEPVMSHFKEYNRELMDGVAFDHSQTEKYEIVFEISGEKNIVFDLTMGFLPKSIAE